MATIGKAAVIGGGVIGAGWAARLVLNGIDVSVYDPDPEAGRKISEVLDNARQAYKTLFFAGLPREGTLTHAASLAEAVSGADFIQKSVPERLDVKHRVLAEICAHAPKDAVVGSSTSGLLPSQMQTALKEPERFVVAHPYNPVYLLPLVEIVGGVHTAPETIERARKIYASIGMKPVVIRKEIEAFVGDRLLEAIWREALWLIKDGICTTQELDDIVRFSFGLRYAQMGVFEVFRVAGGEAGMRHFLAQFGPALQWPWTKLTDVPEFDDELVDLIAGQSDAQSGHHSIRELERIRDDNLAAIMQALKRNDWGAGKTLAAHENKLLEAGVRAETEADHSRPIRTSERRIPPGWADYNGHMNEAHYLQCFADATDVFMRLVGADSDYVASGLSYFTVETHIRHLDEVRTMEPVHTLTQVLEGKGKKMRLFHWLHHDDGRLLATGEHMLIHVSLETRAACDPAPQVAEKLGHIAELHARLPMPEGAGRAVGQARQVTAA